MKPYFLTFEYSATGEGFTESFGVFHGTDARDAIIKFLSETVLSRDEIGSESFKIGYDYFSVGVHHLDLSGKKNILKMEKYLKEYLTPPVLDQVIRATRSGCVMNFKYHLYFNLS